MIAPMRAAHIDSLMPFEKAMFGSEAWTASGYRRELADTEHRHYIVAEQIGPDPVGPDPVDAKAGSLVGWAGVLILAEAAEILTVGVVPFARRRGIARVLVDRLVAEAVARGAREVFLEVRVDNAAARALYADAGFAEIGIRTGYYDLGRIDAVVMRRAL